VTTGWRIGALGVAFLVLFGLLTLRLWQIQVTEAAEAVEAAERNQIDFATTPAPRGEIRDRNGALLAGTKPVLSAVIDGQLVDEDAEDELIARLAAFSLLDPVQVELAIDTARLRGDRVVLVDELTPGQAVFLVEHAEDFPGVSVEPQPVRIYPLGNLAADIVGYIGKPTQSDVDAGASLTELLGRAGVERQYNDLLAGEPGLIKYRVDAQRNVLEVLNEQSSSAGGSITLSIDVELQRVLEDSLASGLQLARNDHGDPDCVPDQEEDPLCPVRAVGVVLDATNGEVLAMASVPTYDPNMFVAGVSQAELDALPEGVLDNFAVRGEYAPASTFKAVTYVTAMEEGIKPQGAASLEQPILCSRRVEFLLDDASQRVWNNWTRRDDGEQDIHTALMRSCNVYFWELAWSIWQENKGTEQESIIQDWARELGLGASTAVDLPFEKSGIIPDRALFEEWAQTSPFRLDAGRLEPGIESPWFGGDLLNAATGQGEMLVTPLQLANAYAAMVNGGELWQPRIVLSIVDADGNPVLETSPQLANTIPISDTTLIALRRDLQQVVNNSRGTASKAFEDFGENKEKVGGKTGTAEVIKSSDEIPDGVQTALFVAVAPIDAPRYVVVIVIERGGSGGRVAAPTAKPVLQYLLNGPDAITEIREGEDSER
jgi:penicillin-binding protein 2